MNYKIVVWGDFAIPVPLWANWMAWDENGDVFAYSGEPNIVSGGDEWALNAEFRKLGAIAALDVIIPPPEPGPWNKQLYWIG